MIRIDLLPKEERKRKAPLAPKVRAPRARRPAMRVRVPVGVDAILVLIIFLIILGVMYIYYAGQKREITRLNDEIAAMQAELRKLKEAVQLVKELEEKEHAIKVKLGVIGELNKHRFVKAHMMDELSKFLPDNVWLMNVVERMPSVTIEGMSFSNFTVADFMERLESSNYFKNVDLSLITRDRVAGHDVMKFKLTASLISYTPPEAPADSVKKAEG